MAKRQSGEGSFYTRDGRFVWQAPRLPGTNKRPTVSAATKRELLVAKRELEAKIAAGAPLGKSVTLNAFLDRYLKSLEGTDTTRPIRRQTLVRHITSLKPIRDLLGAHRLDTLKVHHLQDAYQKMSTEYHLAPSSIARCHAVLHKALKTAVAWEVLTRNPADFVSPPAIPHKEQAFLSLEEAQKLMSLTAEDRHHALWHTLLFAGLRIGEALALQWDEVDFGRQEISVNATLLIVPGKGHERGEVKTKNGRRVIPVDDALASSLKRWSTRQKEERIKAGPLWRDLGYVFTNSIGEPIWYESLRKEWNDLRQKVTEKTITLHGLRHTCALFHLGYLHTTDYEMTRWLGHSSSRITHDIYGHLRDEAPRETAQRMGALLQGNEGR